MERGDFARAQELLREKAERRGYTEYDTAAERQNHVIQAANPVADDYHTWIRGADEVKSFAQTLNDPDWAGMDFDPDYTWEMAQDALHQANVETAKPYDIRYDAASGTWRGGDSYGEWKGAQVYDARKALPLPTSGDALKGMRDSAAQAQAYKRAHPETPEQAAERKAKDAQRAKETLMWPVHQTMAAIGGFFLCVAIPLPITRTQPIPSAATAPTVSQIPSPVRYGSVSLPFHNQMAAKNTGINSRLYFVK